MCVKYLFLILFPLAVTAQKVEQTTPFQYTDYQRAPTQANLAAIGFDPVMKMLTIYGWHPMKGRVATEKTQTAKKGGSLLGKLVKVAASVSSFEGRLPGAEENESAVPMVFARTVALPSLVVTSQQRDFISPDELDPMKKYYYATLMRGGDDTPVRMPITLDLRGAAQKYPLLAAPDYKPEFILQPETGLAVATRPTPAVVISPGTGQLGYRPFEAPKRDATRQQLTGLKPVYGLPTYAIPGSDLHVSLVTADDREDKWAMYKQYRFVISDKTCGVVRIIDPKFEYIRDLNTVSDVFDETGKPKGLLLTFGNLTSFAGKKHRDPLENRHNVIFIDTDGNSKFTYGFEHGNPDNGRSFNPVLTVEKDGQLRTLSVNYEKLSKPYLETVVLDIKGKVSATRSEQPLVVNGTGIALINGRLDRIRTYHFNNLIYVVKQAVRTEMGKTVGQLETTYSDVQIVAFRPDLTVAVAVSVPTGGKTNPTQITLISEADVAPCLVLTSPVGNQFVSLGKSLKVTDVTPSDGRVPASPVMSHNFAYDPTTRKAYFIYETSKSGEGKLTAVSLESSPTNR